MDDTATALSDYQTQQKTLARRQLIADMLLKQGMQQPQGHMAGRFYVPPSPLQGLASMLSTVGGIKMQGDVNAETGDLRNKFLAQVLGGNASPTNPPDTANNPSSDASPQPNPTAGGPSRSGMPGGSGIDPRVSALILSGDPSMQKLGDVIQENNKPIVAREGAPVYERGPDGRLYVSAFTPKMEVGQTIAPGGGVQTVPGYIKSSAEIAQNKEDVKSANEIVDVPLASGKTQKMTRAQFLAATGQGKPSAQGNGASGVPGIVTGQSTLSKDEQANRGKNLAELEQGIDTDARNATIGNIKLNELQDLASNFTPGKAAPLKQWLGEYAAQFNLPFQKQIDQASDMEAFNKIALGMATQAAKQLSSRPTQLEFEKMMESNPNISLLPKGMQQIILFSKYQNDLAIQKQQAKQDWIGKNGSMDGFESNWNKQLAEKQKAQAAPVQNNPTQRVSNYTKADLEHTAKKYGITVDEVKRKLGVK